MAECQYKQGSSNQAQTNYNYVIAKSPNQFVERSLRNSAELYYKDKDYKMAYQRYQQLEEIAASQSNVLLAMNGELRTSFENGDYDKTIDMANKILNTGYADNPSKTAAQFYMGKSQLQKQQLDQALANFNTVYENDKSEMGAEAMYDVADIQYLQEKYTDAQKTIFALKDKFSFYDYWYAKAFILLADTYVKTGDTFQAKSTLQSIIDNYKGNDDILQTAKDKLNSIQDNEKGGKK
jgi:lipopolysaccharide biosynthesis regulator YciM